MNAITHPCKVALQRALDEGKIAKYIGFKRSTMANSLDMSLRVIGGTGRQNLQRWDFFHGG